MAASATGFGKTIRGLKALSPEIHEHLTEANRENGRILERVAKVFVPVRSGRSKAEINSRDLDQDTVLVDFGPKAKVIEGRKGPRPFVNPALRATRKKRRANAQRAIREAAKMAFKDG